MGGAGHDKLYGGHGADRLDGGDGLDYARYDDVNYGNIIANLASPAQNTGAAAGDTYAGIEGVVGGVGHDMLFGNGVSNWLYGSPPRIQIDGYRVCRRGC